MLTISKPLSSSQAQTYHKMEFTSGTQSYYSQGDAVQGEWQGQLAEKFGLSGEVKASDFALLTEGKHPQTEQQLVKHRAAQEYANADGTTTKAVEHRAGWDATFSAPKSVSLTALVGGDEQVREAHRAAVTSALTELERYTQARIGGNNQAETTGKFIAAKFEHDTARPVDGYAAPQLHTHAVIFNVTERADGSTRALQPQSYFDSQNFATAVYQSALTYELRRRGYEIEAGKSGAPEIKGYSQEYLEASSPRSQQIREHLEKTGKQGPEAAQIAAHATRDSKQLLTPEEVLRAHKEMAATYGDQAQKVVAEARQRAQSQEHRPGGNNQAKEALNYARASNFEREAVVDERTILRDALRRGMGETTYSQIRQEFDARKSQGDFLQLETKKHDTGRSFTTKETIAQERANVAHVMRGQNTVKPMMNSHQAADQAGKREFLNPAQRQVIEEVLTTRDRIHGLQGLAGTGKTTTLAAIREGAERSGYAVEGFAPTSKAAGALREAGVNANTLQSFLVRKDKQPAGEPAKKHLYMLDESSLASTKQMRAFLDKIKPEDRVLVIGDTGQHQGVDAGRPFEQMQDAGMRTSRLDQIVRQKDPELLKAVEHLAKKETEIGVKMLADQGRVVEIANPEQRIQTIAKDYAARPENTIIVSPDNRSRQAINQAVRAELQAGGTLAADGQEMKTLVHRSDMTGADREWAARYHAGDVLKYTAGSKAQGLKRGSYATVLSTNAKENTVTVERADGQSVTYDPKRLKGVNIYTESSREFATGERVQFTNSDKSLGVSNRDLGTVTKMEPNEITVRMDGKDNRSVSFDPTQMRHLDHGYAVTSHSSQGLTQRKVIANIDTEAARALINTRLGYVAFSRSSDDLRIYTNDAETLGKRLATEVTKTAAVDFRPQTQQAVEPQQSVESRKSTTEKIELQTAPSRVREFADHNHRTAAVAADYVARPANTVIVAPDQAERRELTQLIRADLRDQGVLTSESRSVPIRIDQELSNRKIAANYAPGDIVQYRTGESSLQIASNSAATVLSVDPKKNTLTVQAADGQQITYNPVKTKSLTTHSTVYKEELRELAIGDRVQFTAPNREQGIRKGDFGTVAALTDDNALSVRLDNGKAVELNAEKSRHIDHGYAVDGQKTAYAERVLVSIKGAGHIAPEDPLYKTVSRASQNTTIYTSDPASVHEKVATEQAYSQNAGRLAPDKSIEAPPTKAEFERLTTPPPQQERQQQISQGLSL
jgi:conjugative relaxase-like TrwC/TraI family protein